jgi:hypothetical protein
MANSLSEVSKQLRQLAKNLPLRVNDLKKDVTKTINFDLLQTTPVDTGQAVSNWQVQLDSAAEGIRPPFVDTPKGFMKQTSGVRAWNHRSDPEVTRQANIGPALEVASATIEQAQPGQEIHVTNNLPYIQALDEGHSSQAQNFVSRAIILGRDLVTRANLLS